jgi:hypothetical protein
VIERLGPGAVINQKAFFVDDKMEVNMRTGMNTDMYELDRDTLDDIRLEYPDFSKKLQIEENNFLKAHKQYPLDYTQPAWVEEVPNDHPLYNYNKEKKLYEVERMQRENILKNIVFRKIISIRFEKSKPKINDIIVAFNAQKNTGKEGKDQMIKKLKIIYLGWKEVIDSEEDQKYQRISTLINRIYKVLQGQATTITNIHERMNVL